MVFTRVPLIQTAHHLVMVTFLIYFLYYYCISITYIVIYLNHFHFRWYPLKSIFHVLFNCIALLRLKDEPVYEVNKSSVTIKWSEPDKTQSLSEPIFYDVECFLCKEKICSPTCENVIFSPGNKNIKTTFVVVTKLTTGKTYLFRVYPKNSLNKYILKNQWKYMETGQFTLVTYQSPSKNFLNLWYLFLFMQIAFHDSPKQKVLYRGMEMLGRFNFPFGTGPFVFAYCPVCVDKTSYDWVSFFR